MINTSLSKAAIALAAVMILAAGCQTAATNSGYLTSYEGFRDGPEGGVDRIWTHPDIKTEEDLTKALKPYKKIMLEPIWVSLNNRESYDGMDPEELVKLTRLFRVEILTQLNGAYPVVEEPGPDVLRIQIGLTGVETPNQASAAVSSILPVGLALSFASKAVTGEHTNVGSATVEALITDSTTGQSIIAAVDRQAGEKGVDVIQDPQSAAKKAFKWWAARLRATLDKAHQS